MGLTLSSAVLLEMTQTMGLPERMWRTHAVDEETEQTQSLPETRIEYLGHLVIYNLRLDLIGLP